MCGWIRRTERAHAGFPAGLASLINLHKPSPPPHTHNLLQLCADALAEARKMAEETKKMYNPMNQPLVKSLLSQVQ